MKIQHAEKTVAKVCMFLLLGAILFAGCAMGTGYESEEAAVRTALPAAAALPEGIWYTHLDDYPEYNTEIDIDLTEGTIAYTGSWADYDYVANIVASYAFFDEEEEEYTGAGVYVVQFEEAPIDAYNPNGYYVVYYEEYDSVAGTAKIADAYSEAYDPILEEEVSVRRVYVNEPSESILESHLYDDVGWGYVSPYYLNAPPASR